MTELAHSQMSKKTNDGSIGVDEYALEPKETLKKNLIPRRVSQLLSAAFLGVSLTLVGYLPVLGQENNQKIPIGTYIDENGKRGSTYDLNNYRMPFNGMYRITQGASFLTVDGRPCDENEHMSHHGEAQWAVDFLMAEGTNLYATAAGEIVYAGWMDKYGYLVIIQNHDGPQSWYGHLSKMNVAVGDIVMQGDLIGLSGKSGTSQAHFHFEIRVQLEDGTFTSIPITIPGMHYLGGLAMSCSFDERFEGYGENIDTVTFPNYSGNTH